VPLAALSHCLYVDRRGAPENPQDGFGAPEKFTLGRAVARATPDGNTLLINTTGLLISPYLQKATFDPRTSFEPICQLVSSPTVFVVHGASPYHTMNDLIAAARAKPGEVTMGSIGPASAYQLGLEALKRAAKVDITSVPYRGTGPGLADLLAGRVPLMWATPVALIPHVQAGKAKALAVASLKRAASLPQAATIAESALPGFKVEIWFGVSAPAKTPPAVVAQLAKELEAIMAMPDVHERMRKFGFDHAYAGSDAFRKLIADDHARYGEAIRAAGIAPK